jgi:hypothetical protein
MNTSRSDRGVEQVEVDVEAVREGQRRALLHVAGEVGVVDVRLQLVRGQHHHDVGPLGAVGRAHHREAGALGLLDRGRAGLQRNAHVLDARITEVHGVGMTLAAVADDQDLLALDQVHVGITIVVDTHRGQSSWQLLLAKNGG